MATLINPRWERFAQAVAGGKPALHAYPIAGYTPNTGNPYRLKENERVASRIAELLNKAAIQAEFTKARAIEVSLDAADRAGKQGQGGAEVAGIRLACDVAGHIVNKSLNINADIDDLTPAELDSLRAIVHGTATPLTIEGGTEVAAPPRDTHGAPTSGHEE